jgi:hypothetical protein
VIDYELDVDEVVEGIDQVGRKLRQKVPDALELGAELVVNRAKQVHGFKDQTGELTNSIASDGVQGTWGADLHAIVAAGAAHGIFVHEGTEPHKIKPKHRKSLRWPGPDGFVFAKGVDHPGTDADPFLANALEAKLGEVDAVLQDAVDASFAEAGFEVD